MHSEVKAAVITTRWPGNIILLVTISRATVLHGWKNPSSCIYTCILYTFCIYIVLFKNFFKKCQKIKWVTYIVCAFFGIAFLWDWNENWPFPVLWPLLSFPNLLAYWVQHFHSISFRIWNSSAGIPSPPLALFIVMLPKAHLTSHSRISGSRWVITPSWLSGSWRSFLYSSVYSATS